MNSFAIIDRAPKSIIEGVIVELTWSQSYYNSTFIFLRIDYSFKVLQGCILK